MSVTWTSAPDCRTRWCFLLPCSSDSPTPRRAGVPSPLCATTPSGGLDSFAGIRLDDETAGRHLVVFDHRFDLVQLGMSGGRSGRAELHHLRACDAERIAWRCAVAEPAPATVRAVVQNQLLIRPVGVPARGATAASPDTAFSRDAPGDQLSRASMLLIHPPLSEGESEVTVTRCTSPAVG